MAARMTAFGMSLRARSNGSASLYAVLRALSSGWQRGMNCSHSP